MSCWGNSDNDPTATFRKSKVTNVLSAENIHSNEQVSELFYLALGGDSEAPLSKSKSNHDLKMGSTSKEKDVTITKDSSSKLAATHDPLPNERDYDGKMGSTSKQGDVARKLLTTHRRLIIERTKLSQDLSSCVTLEQFNHCSSKLDALQSAYDEFRCDLELVTDPYDLLQVNDRIAELYTKCCVMYNQCEIRLLKELGVDDPETENAVEPSDSVSQAT